MWIYSTPLLRFKRSHINPNDNIVTIYYDSSDSVNPSYISRHALNSSALPLLVSRVRLAVHIQAPPPSDKEAVFAALFQGRLGLHPHRGMGPGKTQQGRRALDREDRRKRRNSGRQQEHRARGGRDRPHTPVRTRRCRGDGGIETAHLENLSTQRGSQVLQQEGTHGDRGCRDIHEEN